MSLMAEWAAVRKTAIRNALASGNRGYAESLASGASAESWGAMNWITEWDREQVQQTQQVAQIEQATQQAEQRTQESTLATQQAEALYAQRQKEIEAANVAAEAVKRANEAKKLFRGNMATLSMNSQNENAPSVVGGATAYADKNSQSEGANLGRPRARRSALASQLGVGV